jgi:hypothetical protein
VPYITLDKILGFFRELPASAGIAPTDNLPIVWLAAVNANGSPATPTGSGCRVSPKWLIMALV